MERDNIPSTTTEEQDKVSASQRKVNVVWEVTHAIIAVSITLALIAASMTGNSSPALTNAFFLVVGFYFSRTNHSNVGGVGPKPFVKYMGR